MEIQVENLRNIADSGTVSLKPLVVLVGRNSSGKSTLLRLLPLLRQTTDNPPRGALLWNGKFVDFGDFATARSRHQPTKPIALRFSFSQADLKSVYLSRGFPPSIDVKLEIDDAGDDKASSRVSGFTVAVNDMRAEFALGNQDEVLSQTLNGFDSGVAGELCWSRRPGQFIPEISRRTTSTDPMGGRLSGLSRLAAEKIKELVPSKKGQPVKIPTLISLVNQLKAADRKTMASDLKRQKYAKNAEWLDLLINNANSPRDALSCLDWIFFSHLPVLIDAFNRVMMLQSLQFHYVAPFRASAERYYRMADFIIDELDSIGRNMPHVVASFPEDTLSIFNDILSEAFGITIKSHSDGGHLSLMLAERGSSSFTNIADCGFGYSQVLPVMTQLFLAGVISRKGRSGRMRWDQVGLGRVVAVEQPELHLHPAMQAQLARALCATLNKANRNSPGELSLFVETHSRAMVEEFGLLIANGNLNPNDVEILAFEAGDGSPATIRRAFFEPDGSLVNWPYGFFSPDR